jgi:hypothetical protein
LNTKLRNWILLGVLVVVAVLLAPFMQVMIEYLIIEPIAYYGWRLKRMSAIIPQEYYWLFIIASIAVVVFFSILRSIVLNQTEDQHQAPQKGQVEELANHIQRTQKSTYFKWMMANKLAKLAVNILSHQNANNGDEHRDFSTVIWDPPQETKKYLETGLNSSFMEYHPKRRFFKRKRETPFDVDLNTIIDYLESEME